MKRLKGIWIVVSIELVFSMFFATQTSVKYGKFLEDLLKYWKELLV